jgi:serpin B
MSLIRKIFFAMMIGVLFLTACSPSTSIKLAQSNKPRNTTPQSSTTDLESVVSGNNAFALDLYHKLDGDTGNVFFSPYSISLALAMTYAGSRGNTEMQMGQAMHFSLSQAQLHPALNQLALELDKRARDKNVPAGKAFTLHVANALWGQVGFTFLPDFLDILAQNYGAGMQLLDFSKEPESARNTINQWVSKETANKINDIIPQGAIDSLTRLVLSNAIYFKADWQSEFSKDATQNDVFHLLEGGTITGPMMKQKSSFRYASAQGLQMVELPYAGGQLSMLVLLPEDGKFNEVSGVLDLSTLDSLINSLDYKEVNLTLPKFTFEYNLGLNDYLKQLGMTEAFDPTLADFSGMDGAKDLYISDVLHKAFVSVDEAGTEAAAATVVIVGVTSMPVDQPIEFKADRPFIFAIRDNGSGTLLFLGRLMDPAGGK